MSPKQRPEQIFLLRLAPVKHRQWESRPKVHRLVVLLVKKRHLLLCCPVFREKNPTQRTKLFAENRLCFSFLNEQHSFCKGPKPRNCSKQGCSITENTLLHGSEKFSSQKHREKLKKPRKFRQAM